LLFGGFQQGRFLRESYAQWVELARTAQRAVVFAQFTDPVPPTAPRVPVEVSIPSDAPLQREWLVVCDAPDYPAVMVGWERPGQAGLADSKRRFEVLWSVDARVVRDASRICLDLADTYRPGWRSEGIEVPLEDPPAASSDLRRATDLLNRTMGYLDASTR
jgi:DICT domain-containing protein